MGRRVLLTGGTGLVGTDVLQRLVEEQYQVVSLGRRRPQTTSSRVTWIEADLATEPRRTLESLPAVDHVVHAAAARTAKTDEELAHMRRVNVGFTEAMFNWAAGRRVDAVIYLSGFNLLRRPLEAIIDESHPVAPLTPYAETKHRGEMLLADHSSRQHFRGVTLRVSSPIPFSYELLHQTVVAKWIDRARGRQSIGVHGRGERCQDFVATEDVAAAVVRAIETPQAYGTYNVASGTALSMLELARLIAARWDAPIVLEREDANTVERWNISIDRASAELGYRPRYTARAAIERLLTMLS
jgi:UDP-glucose 4-epimerase